MVQKKIPKIDLKNCKIAQKLNQKSAKNESPNGIPPVDIAAQMCIR